MKKKFKIKINWRGEQHLFYTKAGTKIKAVHNAAHQLAKKIDCNIRTVLFYILDKDSSYIVEEKHD